MNPRYKYVVDEIKALNARKTGILDAVITDETREERGVMTEAEEAEVNHITSTLDKLQSTRQGMEEADELERSLPAYVISDPMEITESADRSTVRVGPPNILKDPNRGFTRFGEFCSAIAKAHTPGGVIDNRLEILTAASGGSMGVGSDGGFLIPPTFSTAIWDGLNVAPDNLLGMTDNYTVTGDSLTFNANAETSRATGSRYGGIRGYWIAEADQITSSFPKFRQMKLEPQQLAVLVYETNKVLNNAPALEQHLTKAATEEINFLVGDAIINGTGAGQPLGVMNCPCTYSVSKETGQAAKTIVPKNIQKMFAAMHTRSLGSAVWFINQDVWPGLFDMAITVGTGGLPVFQPPGGLSVAPYGTLLGRPVMPIEYCQTLGTVGDIIFADLKSYATGTRGGVDSAMSIHLRFDYAESVFRFMFEVDGQGWLAAALTPFKGTASSVSTFVTLATRA